MGEVGWRTAETKQTGWPKKKKKNLSQIDPNEKGRGFVFSEESFLLGFLNCGNSAGYWELSPCFSGEQIPFLDIREG